MNPSIALIHATYAAVPPVEQAFALDWPQATTVSLLAEDLTHDLAQAGTQTVKIRDRIGQLAMFASMANVDGILYTCSAFAKSIDSVRENSSIPILKPNEAMFEEALELGGRTGMLVTFEAAIPSMTNEYAQMAQNRGQENTLEAHFVPGAFEALSAGKADEHNMLLAQAAEKFSYFDVLMLAQFSMSEAALDVKNSTDANVLTSPGSAISKLKTLIRV